MRGYKSITVRESLKGSRTGLVIFLDVVRRGTVHQVGRFRAGQLAPGHRCCAVEHGPGDRVGLRLLALALVFLTYNLRKASSIFCGSAYLEMMLEKLTTTECLLNT